MFWDCCLAVRGALASKEFNRMVPVQLFSVSRDDAGLASACICWAGELFAKEAVGVHKRCRQYVLQTVVCTPHQAGPSPELDCALLSPLARHDTT